MHLSLEQYRCSSLLRDLALVVIACWSFASVRISAQDRGPQWFAEGAVLGSLFAPSFDPYVGTISLNASGALGMHAPVSDVFWFGGSLGYQWMPGVMRYDEPTVLSIEDDPVPAVIRHDNEISMSMAYVEPTFGLQLSRWQFTLGARVGLMLNGEFTSTQRVIDPPGVSFDEGPVRVDSSGDYPGLSPIAVWATVGASFTGRRLGTFRLDPGVTFSIPVTSMSTVSPFRIWSAGATLRVVYDPMPALPRRVDSVFITDTIVVESTSETGTRETMTITRVDSTVTTLPTEVVTVVTVRRELVRTVGIGMPVILTQAQALFLTPDGQMRERMTLRVVTDRHELRVVNAKRSSVDVSSMPKELIDTVITDVVDAAFVGVQRLPSTAPVRWNVERWDTCRVRFILAAGGDTDPAAWKVIIKDAQQRTVDSLGGTGQPPATLDHVIRTEVLRTLRTGGTLSYSFAVSVDPTRWTEPVSGTLAFEAMKERAGTTFTWSLRLPTTQPPAETVTHDRWTDEQRRRIERRRSAWSPVLLNSVLSAAP